MIEFFKFKGNPNSRAIIEIQTTDPRGFAFIDSFCWATSKTKLPDEVSFRIIRGKRWTDFIVYHQAWCLKFYSQKIIDLLSTFLDMSDKCYPIHIEGTDQQYYIIYNLKEYPFLNQKYGSYLGHACYFELFDNYPPLFTLTNSNLLVCTKELKEALLKAKLKNIDIGGEIYGLSQEEKAIYEATTAKEERAAYEGLKQRSIEATKKMKEIFPNMPCDTSYWD